MKTYLLLLITTSAILLSAAVDAQDYPNECDRGVRRPHPHPGQAKMYQIADLTNVGTRWIDVTCPDPDNRIFDPRMCQCVASWSVNRQRWHSHSRPVPTDDEIPDWVVRQPSTRRDRQVWNQGRGRVWDQGQNRSGQKDNARHVTRYDDLDTRHADNICRHHRAAPDVSKYQHLVDPLIDRWEEVDCNWPVDSGLVWNQGRCQCVWGPNSTHGATFGVQGESISIEKSGPSECLVMLNMTFNQGAILDNSPSVWLDVIHSDMARTQRDTSAKGGFVAMLRGASIRVPYFINNELGSMFHVGFRFRLCEGMPRREVPLLHNGCDVTGHSASVMMSYLAQTNTIIVTMETEDTSMTSELCMLNDQQSEWVKLDVRYGGDRLEVKVDGEVCVESRKFTGPLKTNICPLTMAGEDFCGSLDDVLVTKKCAE